MSSSRIIATRKRQVFMAHICSGCGFPIISIVEIEAVAQKTYAFMQSKAEQIASQTANDAIENNICRIESCRSTKIPLAEKVEEEDISYLGCFCDSSILGLAAICPCCGNVEPWQPSKSVLPQKKMSDLEEKNFPIVFREGGKAERWAKDYVANLIADIKGKRKDPALVKQFVSRTLESIQKIKAWEMQIASIPEVAEKDSIMNQLQELGMRKSNIGLLDFKGKKEVSLNAKMLKLRLADINKIIAEKENPIRVNILLEKQLLLHTQAIAFGCTENILWKRKINTFIYQFEPNTVPEELLNQMDSHSKESVIIDTLHDGTTADETNDVATMLFCRKCGFKLIPGSVFCTKCGAKVD